MNTLWLRSIIRRYGTVGLLFAGAVLALHSLRRRKALALLLAGTALAACLFTGNSCEERGGVVSASHRRVSMLPAEEEPEASYTVTDLGTLPGGEFSEGLGINADGLVAGISDTKGDRIRGVVWDNGKIRDLGTLGGPNSLAYAVNNAGQVVGIAENARQWGRAFRWENGKISDLGDLGGGFALATAINNRSEAVGISLTGLEQKEENETNIPYFLNLSEILMHKSYLRPTFCGFSDSSPGEETLFTLLASQQRARMNLTFLPEAAKLRIRAALWRNGRVENLGTLPGCGMSEAIGLNDQSDVIGLAFDGDFEAHAFLWKNGQMQELQAPRGEAIVSAINNSDQIAGMLYDEAKSDIRAVLWNGNKAQELPLPSGSRFSTATAISDNGTVVGAMQGGNMPKACLWKDGKVVDLSEAVSSSGWKLLFATGINARGQIIGLGYHNDAFHGFLLTPR